MMFRSLPHTLKYAGVAVVAIVLPACGTTQKSSSAASVSQDEYREAIDVFSSSASDTGMDPIAAAAFWGTRYNTNQSDPDAAVKFSQALRKIGSTSEAVGVMQKASALLPENTDVSLEYGKVLVDSGRAFEAVRHLETASAAKPGDWRALSAYGVALDQIGEHESARKKYDLALTIAPDAVSVMNNKGLSFALEGDLSMARLILHKAAGRAGGDARVRQNLALILALSGDMQGAERLARSDLPPQVANNNIDYFRQLMNQPAYWGEYAASDVSVPDFDAAPSAPLKPTPSAPKQKLQEEPKPKEEKQNNQPIALIEVAPVTNVSTGVELKDDND
jgi:Flp pilus assembly protein TadD